MIRVAIVEDEAAVRDQRASRFSLVLLAVVYAALYGFCICLNSAELRRPG